MRKAHERTVALKARLKYAEDTYTQSTGAPAANRLTALDRGLFGLDDLRRAKLLSNFFDATTVGCADGGDAAADLDRLKVGLLERLAMCVSRPEAVNKLTNLLNTSELSSSQRLAAVDALAGAPTLPPFSEQILGRVASQTDDPTLAQRAAAVLAQRHRH
jgi:hypothetical protein